MDAKDKNTQYSSDVAMLTEWLTNLEHFIEPREQHDLNGLQKQLDEHQVISLSVLIY